MFEISKRLQDSFPGESQIHSASELITRHETYLERRLTTS